MSISRISGFHQSLSHIILFYYYTGISMNGFYTIARTFLLPIILVSLLAGCSKNHEMEKDRHLLAQNESLRERNTQLKEEINAKKTLTANLKMELLAKNAEINKLKVIQQGLGKEVVRRKTRMVLPKNKAEAVAVLAETETEINAARERAMAGNPHLSFDNPDQLMSESQTAFDLGNYTLACTLAAQALEQVQFMKLKAETIAKPAKGLANHFVFPLGMQLVVMSNIREKPSMKGRVVRILEKGTMVTAIGYHGHWIKIAIKDQPIGWIYYSLLALPES